MSYGGPEPGVEIQLHDFALAMTKLDEVHEELCHLWLRSRYQVVGDVLVDLYAVRYLLS